MVLVGGAGFSLVQGNSSSPAYATEPYLVKDIYPGSDYSYPESLTNVDGTLFFSAEDSLHGEELWKSDGTTDGTVLVKDIFPGDKYDDSNPEELADVNGLLFFSADDGVHGSELWMSDGTAGGTRLVKDIFQGSDEGYPNESEPEGLTNVNGKLFFNANDGIHGRELWVSDGTADGTVLVKDIMPIDKDDDGSGPGDFTDVNGTLFFRADDGVHGQELWALKVAGGCANCIFLPIIQ
jgi:ELWxxDGT repeat protein